MTWSTSNHTEFALPVEFAIGAVFFFAVTGALSAMRRHYDIIGVFTMAFVAGLGGALIRDGIFIQDGPPALTRDWRYLGAVFGGCVVGWLVGKFIERFQRLIAIIDAAGLAAFSVVGVQMSRAAGLSVPASIFVGVINACGGGLLRDVIVRDEPLMMKPGQFYVLASVIGSGLFAYLTMSERFNSYEAAIIAIALTFSIRMLSIRFNWRTTPLLPLKRVSALVDAGPDDPPDSPSTLPPKL